HGNAVGSETMHISTAPRPIWAKCGKKTQRHHKTHRPVGTECKPRNTLTTRIVPHLRCAILLSTPFFYPYLAPTGQNQSSCAYLQNRFDYCDITPLRGSIWQPEGAQ